MFEYLAKDVIPGLLRDHPPDRPLRIWIAGCSSGEETYSLAMLLREQIIASKREIKLQIFASDVDPDAVATAREGLYPPSIEAKVSSARLAQFFSEKIGRIESRPNCAPTSSSRCKMFSPIRHSRASTSFRAATF